MRGTFHRNVAIGLTLGVIALAAKRFRGGLGCERGAVPATAPQPQAPGEDGAGSSRLRDGIEGLNGEKLRDRALETSPSGYLTAVSIIQGVVFALLASEVFQQRDSSSVEIPILVIQSVAVVFFLIVVFHFYIMSTMFLRWAPSVLDSAFPFLVAVVEVPTAHFVSRSGPWAVSATLFLGVCGMGAIWTTFFAPVTHFGRADAWANFRHLLFDVGCLGLSFLLLAARRLAVEDPVSGPLIRAVRSTEHPLFSG
jgi:hypothetical protein